MSTITTITPGGVSAMTASNEWASRPADQRFWSIQECLEAARAQKDGSLTKRAKLADLRVEAQDKRLAISRGGLPVDLSNWAFGQLCGFVQAPAGFLTELPGTLAAQVLNNRIAEKRPEGEAVLLLDREQGGALVAPTVRALNGVGYGRVWDTDVLGDCLALESRGFKVPPARPAGVSGERTRIATQADVVAAGNLSLSVKVGDMIAPAGVYRSDRDLFVIMTGQDPIDDGTGFPLFRMVVVRNSEVGGGAWEVTLGYLKGICGNHILHGLTDLRTIRTRHVGQASSRVDRLMRQAHAYTLVSGKATEEKIAQARSKVLGPTIEAVATLLYEKRVASKEAAGAAMAAAVEHEDWYGAPTSAWAVAQGLTEVSQRAGWQGERAGLDRAATKVLDWAF